MEHWFERYDMFHGVVHVGVIAGRGGACGFPSFWSGSIEYDGDLWTRPEAAHLAEYISLAREAAGVLDAGGDPSAIYERVRERYMDVVDSTEWMLFDSGGRPIPIHCPMQHRNDAVSWVRADGETWC